MGDRGASRPGTHLVLVLNPRSRLAESTDRTDFHQAALYRRLVRELGSVSWVSFGGRADAALSESLDGVEILSNRWGLSPAAYVRELPWLHRAAFERATVVKSEQILAGPVATRIACHYGKPLLSRNGFSIAAFATREGWPNASEMTALERQVQSDADVVVVSSELDRRRAMDRTGKPEDRVRVIPNFVDLATFHPSEKPTRHEGPPLLVAAGRIVEQKNFDALVTAVAPRRDVRLLIIGRGHLESALRDRIAREGLDHIRMIPTVSQERLAEHFREATIVLQPSLIEGGHAKTVIEAMACGAAVIGAETEGLDNVIRHDVNGWFCGTDPGSIGDAIKVLLGDPARRERLGRTAHEFVRGNLSLDRAVERELDVLDQVEALAPTAARGPESRKLARSLAETARWQAGRVVRKLDPRGR